MNTPNLSLTDANLSLLDAIIQLAVKDRDLSTPPGSPTNGDRYLVGASPTGAWAGQAGKIAIYYSGWSFLTPREGWRAWIDDEDLFVRYTGSTWQNDVGIPVISPVVRPGAAPKLKSDGTLEDSTNFVWQTIDAREYGAIGDGVMATAHLSITSSSTTLSNSN
jgi:hypothetical protein